MSSSNIYCAYASYYSYVFAPLCLLIFGLDLVFIRALAACLYMYVPLCCFLSFLRLCQPALIWTRLSYTHTLAFMFYRTIKNITFFHGFYVFASFFVSIKAHFMSSVCGFYAESLPLNFTWEGRKNKETLFCNLIYCFLFNFNRTNATFRQFAEPKPNKCFYQNIQSLKQIFDTQSSHLQDENKQNNKPGLYFASI